MKHKLISSIFFIVFLVSCGVNSAEKPPQEITKGKEVTHSTETIVENSNAHTETPTPIKNNTHVTDILPTATTMVKVLPTLTATIEPSFTPSPSPSLTPLPTLNNNDANRTVLELANTNGNCEMPCLWGIVPGKTQWELTDQYYTSLRFDIESDHYKCKDESKKNCVRYTVKKIINGSYYGFGVTVEDSVVKYATDIRNSSKKYFSLDRVLSEFGMPSEIYIDPPIGIAGIAQLPMYLFYDDYSLEIFYIIKGTVFLNFNRFCPYNNEVDLWVSLFEPNSSLYFEIKNSLLIPEEIDGGRYYPIEDWTELTVDDFYELFLNKTDNNCIDLLNGNAK